MDENVQIELGLKKETFDLIEQLSARTKTPNPANTISSSVKLASQLITEVMNGAKIFIEKNGVMQEVKITGLE
jgi:hypothetical protein